MGEFGAMKQTRRGFLGRTLAIAAAVTVAPAVKVEAAEDTEVRQRVADAYERGRAIEQAKAESKAQNGYLAVTINGKAMHVPIFNT